MDIFVEQIVKKPSGTKEMLLKVLIGIAAGLISAVGVLFLGVYAIVIIFGIFYGAYWLMTGLDCEYEYIVTNGEIDVDKIVAKRKRSRLITIKASTFESYGEYKDAPKLENGVTVVKADGIGDYPLYYADFKHNSIGNARLIFTPNDRVLEALKPFLPRAIRVSMNKKWLTLLF